MTQPQQPVAYGCYRHPDRPTYIRCQRCGRPICGDCMVNAAVGFQCPECVVEGARQTRQHELPYGGTRVRQPYLTTLVLIGINAAVWLLFLLTGGYDSPLANRLMLLPSGRCGSVQQPGGFFPNVPEAVCVLDPNLAYWQPGVADGAFWQVLTSAFSHVDAIHIAMNMLSLWFLGPHLEVALGRVRFLSVYLLSALAGSTAVMWLASPQSQTLGASGAVFGLIGALLVLAYKVHGDVRSVLTWLGINLVYTFVAGSSISWQGHIGGLIGGLAATAIIIYAPRTLRVRTQVLGLAGLGVLLIALIAVRVLQLA